LTHDKFRVVSPSLTKNVYIAGYNNKADNMISVMSTCKERFIVHFTFQWWFHSLRIYKRFQRLTLSALACGPL